jgi:DnaJ domain
LGVQPSSTRAEIRRAYLLLARRHHPDHVHSDDPRDRDRAVLTMRELNEAWRVLGDQRARRAYDRRRDVEGQARRASRPAPPPAPSRDPDEPFDRAAWGLDGSASEGWASDGWRSQGSAPDDIAAPDHVAAPVATALKVMPFVVVVLFVVGIFVYSAYAGGDETVAGGAAVTVGACVLGSGDAVQVVPCTAVNDGQVVEVGPVNGRCRDDGAELLTVGDGALELCVVATLATRS